jgi:hypothetical protein
MTGLRGAGRVPNLATIMVLATALHLVHREFSHVVVTVILFALAAFVVYGRGFRAPAASV